MSLINKTMPTPKFALALLITGSSLLSAVSFAASTGVIKRNVLTGVISAVSEDFNQDGLLDSVILYRPGNDDRRDLFIYTGAGNTAYGEKKLNVRARNIQMSGDSQEASLQTQNVTDSKGLTSTQLILKQSPAGNGTEMLGYDMTIGFVKNVATVLKIDFNKVNTNMPDNSADTKCSVDLVRKNVSTTSSGENKSVSVKSLKPVALKNVDFSGNLSSLLPDECGM